MAFSATGLLWASTHVHDDNVAFFEGWDELGLDIGLEDSAVHRGVNDEGRGEGAATQSGDEGLGLPMAERGFRPEALALQATSAQARHFRRGSGLVEEDQPMRLKPHLRLANADPFLARLFDVGPIVLAGSQSFF